jgi:hypothetical protein
VDTVVVLVVVLTSLSAISEPVACGRQPVSLLPL